MSDRKIAEDRARYIGQRSPLFVRVAGLLPRQPRVRRDPPRCFLNFAQRRSQRNPAWECILSLSLSLSLFPSLLDFSFSRCMLLFYESWYFRQSSTSVAFRKGVLGPIISREYHYGYNAPVWSGPLYQDRAAYTDGPYECAKREKERERERERE